MASDADAYERGVKIAQTSLTPNFREGVQANPWFQLGYQMGLKHGPRAAGMMSQAKSEFPNVASRIKASRPGAKAKFEKEYILWALPKGETDRLHERPIVEGIKTPSQMDEAKRKAASQGWHGFRVQILDMSKPFRWMSRPGAKARFAVEDRFYFGKERFELRRPSRGQSYSISVKNPNRYGGTVFKGIVESVSDLGVGRFRVNMRDVNVDNDSRDWRDGISIASDDIQSIG